MRTHRADEATLPDELTSRLDHLGALERNWDSYGAEPISTKAIDVAKVVLCRSIAALRQRGSKNVYPFAIAPVSDGGVQLEWRGRAGFLEIEIAPSGTLSALVSKGESHPSAQKEHSGVSSEDVTAMLLAIA